MTIVFFQLGLETTTGQELLPEAGTNETIGGENQTIDEPNRNATNSEKTKELPDQPLKSLF
jgi:hypothetical protein